jgi:hypothetical protein
MRCGWVPGCGCGAWSVRSFPLLTVPVRYSLYCPYQPLSLLSSVTGCIQLTLCSALMRVYRNGWAIPTDGRPCVCVLLRCVCMHIPWYGSRVGRGMLISSRGGKEMHNIIDGQTDRCPRFSIPCACTGTVPCVLCIRIQISGHLDSSIPSHSSHLCPYPSIPLPSPRHSPSLLPSYLTIRRS